MYRVKLEKDWIVPPAGLEYQSPRYSWASSIMSVYMKFAEAVGALLFNGNWWANTSPIQSSLTRGKARILI